VKVGAREKKVIIFGAGIVAVVLIIYALELVLPNRESFAATVELKKKMLLRQRETLKREEAYKARLDQCRENLQQNMARLLPGDNYNVAGAELQKTLKEFADRSGVEITQKNVLQEKKAQDNLMKVSVRIETNCNLEQLTPFLIDIKNYDKLLTIDEFMISGFKNQKRYEIRPSLTVSGFISAHETKKEENQ
jgi:Tfp pilus assembly protein PilO